MPSPDGDVLVLGLLDVLEQLPRDVLRHSVWLKLNNEAVTSSSDHPSTGLGRSFRFTCHSSRRLADQLTRRLHVDLGEGPDDVLQAAQGSHLACQEGLEKLILSDTVGKTTVGRHNRAARPNYGGEALILKLLLLGGTTSGRLSALQINTHYGATATCGQAIAHFCPAIKELEINVHEMSGVFFTALRGCRNVEKVRLRCLAEPQDALVIEACTRVVLRSLAALPGLRTVSLAGLQLVGEDVALLSALTLVLDLDLGGVSFWANEAWEGQHLGQALGSLTQLVSLDVPELRCDTLALCGAAVNAVAAQLGGLRGLSALSIGRHSALDPLQEGGMPEVGLDAAGLHALVQLTALTQLQCGVVSRQGVEDGGYLPRLRHLALCGHLHGSTLLATLSPFLPLPALQELRMSVLLHNMPAGAGFGDGGGAVGAAAAGLGQTCAMWQAAALQVAAPNLQRVALTLTRDPSLQAPMMGPATALLVPMSARITELKLRCMAVGVVEGLWPVVSQATRLERLVLTVCCVLEGELVVFVGRHMPALRHLEVQDCQGPGIEGQGGLSAVSPVALAEVRVEPLRIVWHPPPGAAVRDEFQRAARPCVTLAGLSG